MIPDHQQAPKAVLEEVGEKITHSSEIEGISTVPVEQAEPEARKSQGDFDESIIKTIDATPPEPVLIKQVEEKIKINFDEPTPIVPVTAIDSNQTEITKETQVTFERSLKFDDEPKTQVSISEKAQKMPAKLVEKNEKTKSNSSQSAKPQNTTAKSIELQAKTLTTTPKKLPQQDKVKVILSSRQLSPSQQSKSKPPVSEELKKPAESFKVATGNLLNHDLSPELIGIVKKKVEPVKPIRVIVPELSQDAQSLKTKGITLILNEQTSVQYLKNQNQSLIAMNSTLDGFRLSTPSNRCEGISGVGRLGANTETGFYISAEIAIPGDVGSNECREEKRKIAQQVDAMCTQFSDTQSQYILPAAWVKTMSICQKRKPA
jgi:hypothetical protein